MAANWKGFTVTGIIGVPGDRTDELVKESARIAARGFHRIVIKEDTDLRGRRKGEVARLLCETVSEESPDRRCDIVLDEVEAFSDALAEMKENEVVVLFYDKLPPVLDILRREGATPSATIENAAQKKEEVVSA
jgi:cyanophycin synthetase